MGATHFAEVFTQFHMPKCQAYKFLSFSNSKCHKAILLLFLFLFEDCIKNFYETLFLGILSIENSCWQFTFRWLKFHQFTFHQLIHRLLKFCQLTFCQLTFCQLTFSHFPCRHNVMLMHFLIRHFATKLKRIANEKTAYTPTLALIPFLKNEK